METVHTIGRRKASVARIYVTKGKGNISVNGKDFKEYFPVETLQYKLNQPFKVIDQEGKFDVKVNVNGGGINGQADAIKLAIARSLCEIDADNRPALKAEGLLTRDPRVVERKKPGQKKARKKFQWVKR
jgi:small subunit ribosomal protein S9